MATCNVAACTYNDPEPSCPVHDTHRCTKVSEWTPEQIPVSLLNNPSVRILFDPNTGFLLALDGDCVGCNDRESADALAVSALETEELRSRGIGPYEPR